MLFFTSFCQCWASKLPEQKLRKIILWPSWKLLQKFLWCDRNFTKDDLQCQVSILPLLIVNSQLVKKSENYPFPRVNAVEHPSHLCWTNDPWRFWDQREVTVRVPFAIWTRETSFWHLNLRPNFNSSLGNRESHKQDGSAMDGLAWALKIYSTRHFFIASLNVWPVRGVALGNQFHSNLRGGTLHPGNQFQFNPFGFHAIGSIHWDQNGSFWGTQNLNLHIFKQEDNL